MAEHLASSLQLSHQSIANLKRNIEYGGVTVIEDFIDFVDEFGHESKAAGRPHLVVADEEAGSRRTTGEGIAKVECGFHRGESADVAIA